METDTGSSETLHHYLRRHIGANVIDFTVRAQSEPGDGVKFYIRPAHVSGDTKDFLLWTDPETKWDLLMPDDAVPRVDPKKFLDWLRAKTQSPNQPGSPTPEDAR